MMNEVQQMVCCQLLNLYSFVAKDGSTTYYYVESAGCERKLSTSGLTPKPAFGPGIALSCFGTARLS